MDVSSRQSSGSWQATPLVVDGIMYLTQRPNDVVALDAKTGPRLLDVPAHDRRRRSVVCCGANNRGLAILGDTLFMGTLDAQLVAHRRQERRARCGKRRSPRASPAIRSRVAPLVVKDKVIVGVGGGEYGIRGFIAAYDAQHRQGSVALLHDSRPRRAGSRDVGSRARRSASHVLRSGSVEARRRIDLGDRVVRSRAEPDVLGRRQRRPRLERTISGPATTSTRDSVVALDADTGKLKWHYQFTPHDRYDYDSVQVPVLADITWQRRAAQGDALGESQRQLLRARSRDGPVPARQAVREGELDERVRRKGPADPDAAAAGHADVSRQSGRHELVFAVIQPAPS